MLPGQADGKAFSMRINAFTVIHIKQPEVRQPFAGRRTDLCQDVLCRHVLIHQQRQVAAHFGKRDSSRNFGRWPSTTSASSSSKRNTGCSRSSFFANSGCSAPR